MDAPRLQDFGSSYALDTCSSASLTGFCRTFTRGLRMDPTTWQPLTQLHMHDAFEPIAQDRNDHGGNPAFGAGNCLLEMCRIEARDSRCLAARASNPASSCHDLALTSYQSCACEVGVCKKCGSYYRQGGECLWNVGPKTVEVSVQVHDVHPQKRPQVSESSHVEVNNTMLEALEAGYHLFVLFSDSNFDEAGGGRRDSL